MSNKYYFHSRISEKKFRHIIQCFAAGLTATETAPKVRLTRKSVNTIFLKIRRCIYENRRPIAPIQLSKFITEDCKYAVASERSHRKSNHIDDPIVFCALFIDSTAQTDIIYASDLKIFGKLVMEIMQIIDPAISDFGFSDARFDEIKTIYFRGIKDYQKSVELFRYFAYEHLKKLKGIRNDKLILHLKECEWRFNNRNKDLYLSLLEMCRKSPIY